MIATLLVAPSQFVYWAPAVVGLLGVIVSIYNLVPRSKEKTGSAPSDGWQIRAALKKHGTPAWREPMTR
jgi:hypothetical protein